MVFSSYIFIFGFLPVTLAGFWIISRLSSYWSRLWLCAASLVFYGWWEIRWVPVLIASILCNYAVGWLLLQRQAQRLSVTPMLLAAVGANLLALGYYKYLDAVLGFFDPAMHWSPGLPLGMSFFTFTQIAFLVDVSQEGRDRYNIVDYLLFVTFFPHLIAGPIVHHRDLIPQFRREPIVRSGLQHIAVGLVIFTIGLAKKTIIADPLGERADHLLAFQHPHPIVSWVAVVGYSMQLYFDFSGYSDMAIGLARMFGVEFPINFDSPYRATSIIDFWQRWHITLTRFLTAYVYNPIAVALVRRRAARGLLSSARVSRTPRGFLELIALPTLTTMVLAGIWHGAGLQFVIFGALHGIYITTNHAWRTFGPKHKMAAMPASRGWHLASGALVYLCVLVAQVFFHAPTAASGFETVSDMSGWHAIRASIPWPHNFFNFGQAPGDDTVPMIYMRDLLALTTAMLIVWCAPNTQQLMSRFDPALALPRHDRISRVRISFNAGWAFTMGLLLFCALSNVSNGAPFIYFQF